MMFAATTLRLYRYAISVGLLLLLCAGLTAQNTIGIPNIINYSKQQYLAGNQNWNIAQDKRGILYFGNNNGLLSFDGKFWRTYPLPNRTIVRSLAIGADERIYIGGQEEFGYFYPDAHGELVYTSLKGLVPNKDNDFADVWNVCVLGNHVFFRSNRRILEYDQQKIIVHASVNWSYLGCTSTELLAYEYEKGLLTYRNGKWVPRIRSGVLPQGALLRAVVPIGRDSILLPTVSTGLFILHHDTVSRFESPDITALAGKNISSACMLDEQKIALVTNLGGCIIINKKGEYIQRLTKQEGVQNNNILSVLLDKDKNLWLGLDNGIDLVTYNNAIKNIYPDQEDRNSGYTSIVYKNELFLGISTGVYKIPLAKAGRDFSYINGDFDFVENSQGQVWALSVANGQLMLGHNKGAFKITGNTAVPIDIKTGFWRFQELYDSMPSSMVMAGTYNGINFYNYKNGEFQNPKIHALFESARFVVRKRDTIWAAHPYKGLYKIFFDRNRQPVATVYPDKNKYLSSNHNKLFELNGKMILTSDNGIFEYDDRLGDFIHAGWFEKIFGGQPVSYLKADKAGNIWFCQDKKLGVVDLTGKTPRLIFITELDNKIMSGGFEDINVVDSNNVFVAAEKGFFHINYADYRKAKHLLTVLIRKVVSADPQHSLVYGGYTSPSSEPSIKHRYNSLHLEFSSILYGQEDNTEYSFLLEGFDSNWSEWTKRTEKDYTNLPAGHYTFRVKCRNNADNESPVSVYSFTILPPWYQTWWAYLVFALAVFSLMYFFYKRQQRKYKRLQLLKLKEQQRKYDEEQRQLQYQHQLEIEKNETEIIRLKNAKLQAEIEQKNLEEEQKRIQYQHQLEVEHNEKEIINLRNEKLQAELEHKNSELASSAMNLVRKIEIFSKLKEDLIQYGETAGADKNTREFQRIIRVLDKELDHTQEWEQFAIHFDSVHTNYLKKLKDHCPDLSTTELKLAAYLRLNLSTKEIAQLMNISIRGVETSRYRLRKKLKLSNEDNLVDFLISVTV